MARLSRSSPACLRPRKHPQRHSWTRSWSWIRFSTSARRDEREDVSMPLRSLHFGLDGGGLVTFLVYPPDDLVLVVKIQWLGG